MKSLRYITAFQNVLRRPRIVKSLPIHIQLEPTTYCNLNCKACTRETYLDHSEHLCAEQFQRIVEQIHPLKISLSGGGEPFLHPHIFEMIHLAKERGCSINTTTNCTLLTPELCSQIVKSGLNLVKISIDGATRETYQKSRREDRFDQVLEGIHALTAAKKHHQASTPFIRFNYVILKDNYDELAETVELAAEVGVDAIYFQPLDLIGIEDRRDELVGKLTYQDLERELRRALEINRRYPVNTNLRVLLKNLPLYWKKYLLETREYDRRICLLPWFSTYMTLDGNVRPCCSCSQPETVMGNIFDTPIEQIWNNSKYQGFRQAIRAGKRPYKICTNCIPETLSDILKSSRILPGFLV